MKKLILYSFFALAAMFASQAQTTPPPAPENKNQAEIKFEEEKFDFGNIKEGELATHFFKFKNTGTVPLILSNLTVQCGCTTPEWPKEPIKPGQTAVIKVVYNTQGRHGAFSKQVTVNSNGKTSMILLTITGNVEPAAQQPTSPVQVVPQH